MSAVSDREKPSCCGCGSTLRFRACMAALTQELFGEIVPLPRLAAAKRFCGVGMSDANVYARLLAKKFSYQNTFYHQEPRLDVTDLSTWRNGPLDFVITTDVFEHIPYPVDLAFRNLRRLLKRSGVCIFSVPYDTEGVTKEHFPTLHKWSIQVENGVRILVNERADGVVERFTELCFHGGDGSTLEMRRFSMQDVLAYLNASGFTNIHVHRDDVPEFGIIYGTQDSFVISCRA